MAYTRKYVALVDRFWTSVEKSEGCWPFIGYRNKQGYGQIRYTGGSLAHRLSWIIHHNGQVPNGLCVLHRCDNPPCVNPAHLFIGTRHDNSRDMYKKVRQARGERNARAKLKEADVLKIRKQYAAGGITLDTLAQSFKVSESAIWLAIRGYNWKHI